MKQITVAFAGSTVTLHYDTSEMGDFLSLLFPDLACRSGARDDRHQLHLSHDETCRQYLLDDGNSLLYRGSLGVKFAAHLYDAVIYRLLNRAGAGIALHAGAVVCCDRVILLPGQSGAGKSTLTFWLASRNCTYLTDELIFIPASDPARIEYFSRPLCLKPGSVPILKELFGGKRTGEVLLDRHGAIIPPRLLKTQYRSPEQRPPVIVLPAYQPDSDPGLEPLSKARLCTLLMGCHVNARNLADHGFRQVLDMARSTVAHRLSYATLQDVEQLMADYLPA